MADWDYKNLGDDIEELNQNLLKINNAKILESESLKNKKLDKSEKKLKKSIGKLFKKS